MAVSHRRAFWKCVLFVPMRLALCVSLVWRLQINRQWWSMVWFEELGEVLWVQVCIVNFEEEVACFGGLGVRPLKYQIVTIDFESSLQGTHTVHPSHE